MKTKLVQASIRSVRLLSFSTWLPVLLLLAPVASAGIINVTAYGAIPNDSIDDSVAIQRAIDAAPDNSTIYFPQGTYLVANVRINSRAGLTLLGDGSTLSILKHNGNYPNIFESDTSSDLVITKLGFDTNGTTAFGGFVFYNAKRITITKNHFFDSNKQPVNGSDRFSWVFGRGSVPSEDILISDNLIEDLQLEVDFGLRVRIEGNTVLRPVTTAGIGVFTVNDNTPAVDYTIQKNTIVDPVVSGGGIVLHLDPPNTNYSTMRKFRILNNTIVYTKDIAGYAASAIRIGSANMMQATIGNVFDDIVIQDNMIYKDPASSYDFGNVEAIIYGNSSPVANFRFDNTKVINNLVYYNNRYGVPNVDIRQKGINYVESNNLSSSISSDVAAPSVPTALTAKAASNQITLMWNVSADNIGVSGYRVYRNGANYGYSTSPFYIDTNLQSGVPYTYAVSAIDLAARESTQSYSVTAVASSTTTGPVLLSQYEPATSTPSTPVTSSTTPDSTAGTTSNLVTSSTTSSPSGGTTVAITTTLAQPTLAVSRTTVAPGTRLTVSWTNIPRAAATDRIGLYKPGADNSFAIEWLYVSCSKMPGEPRGSGSCRFLLPSSLTSGAYEIRLLVDNGRTAIASSSLVDVRDRVARSASSK